MRTVYLTKACLTGCVLFAGAALTQPAPAQTSFHQPMISAPRTATEAQNQALILSLYFQFFNGHSIAFAEHNIRQDYIQHNPTIATGLAPFVALFEGLFQQFPQFRNDIARLSTDGDYVWVQTHHTNDPTDIGVEIIDIYRIQGGKIAEHWDSIEPVSTTPANSNGQF